MVVEVVVEVVVRESVTQFGPQRLQGNEVSQEGR